MGRVILNERIAGWCIDGDEKALLRKSGGVFYVVHTKNAEKIIKDYNLPKYLYAGFIVLPNGIIIDNFMEVG